MLRFVIDDFDSANRFVRTLPPKIKQERFSLDILTNKPVRWTPTHLVLAELNGRNVAMADALYSDDGRGANASLVALHGYGAYAVRALLRLKRAFPADYWESCLRSPTASTMAISRRFFYAAYDQGTWEISQELLRRFGEASPFIPTPILASDELLRGFGLQAIGQMSRTQKREIVAAALTMSPQAPPVVNRRPIDAQSLMAIAFDITKSPMKVRQYTTRMMIVGMGAMAGQIGDTATVKRIVKPRYISKYLEGLRHYLDIAENN